MILHPGILALLGEALISLLLLLYAGGVALRILRRWQPQSSSEEQLALERRAALVAVLVRCALVFEGLSLLLFVYTVEEIHPLFVGAMCATGALNANPAGWAALAVKILIFFAAAGWIALHHLDTRAEDMPLVRLKFAALLPLVPLVAVGLVLQWRYFAGLQPEVITSCCGALFSASGSGIAADLASLPPRPVMLAFYGGALLLLTVGGGCLLRPARACGWVFPLLVALFFPLALVAVVSFISLYIYQLPTHHCPFDMLQQHYAFVGYPLYLGLFAGTLFGLLPGLFRPLARVPSLRAELERLAPVWVKLALLGLALFLVLSTWPLLSGNLRLLG